MAKIVDGVDVLWVYHSDKTKIGKRETLARDDAKIKLSEGLIRYAPVKPEPVEEPADEAEEKPAQKSRAKS